MQMTLQRANFLQAKLKRPQQWKPLPPTLSSTEQVPTVQPNALPGVSFKDPSPTVAGSAVGNTKLRFAFSGAPWREVLRWLADESGLALHVGDLPVGSLTIPIPMSLRSTRQSLASTYF